MDTRSEKQLYHFLFDFLLIWAKLKEGIYSYGKKYFLKEQVFLLDFIIQGTQGSLTRFPPFKVGGKIEVYQTLSVAFSDISENKDVPMKILIVLASLLAVTFATIGKAFCFLFAFLITMYLLMV